MRIDPIISRRFAELATKGEAVLSKKAWLFTSDEGVQYFTIASAPFNEWATNVQNLLQRIFGEDSVHYRNFSEHYKRFSKYESEFLNCHAIFMAAREDYEGGYLFNVSSLAKAEVLSDALAQAKELLNANFKDPASVLARVALETILKELSTKYKIAHSKVDRMNADLCKAGVYNMAKQKQITAWAEIGNKAAHGDWNDYNANDTRAMIDGVESLIADLL